MVWFAEAQKCRRVVQKSTCGLQLGGSAQQNRSFRVGETLTFTKRPVQLTVWSPFRGVGSGSETTIPQGAVALFDPPPAPRRSTSPRSRGVKFDLPGKATRRSGQRTVFVKMSVSLQRFALTKRPFLCPEPPGLTTPGGPTKADRPPWGLFSGPQQGP